MSKRRAITSAAILLQIGLVFPAGAESTPEGKKKQTVADVLQNIEKRADNVKLKKQQIALPEFKAMEAAKKIDLKAIQPPSRSTLYYGEGTNESELEKVTDEGIKQLFKLTQQFKTSKRRGELWLRLAELYVEKARLIEYREESAYNQKIKLFQQGKSQVRPKLNNHASQQYNNRAIQLYEWFMRDFPNDPKIDQALFFLGYNYFQINQYDKGRASYERLAREHPQSPFVDEANFALGEFFFDNEKWTQALEAYEKVTVNQRARLYSFALYKSAWCQYKKGRVSDAIASLEKVILAGRSSKTEGDSGASGNRIRLAGEAIRDLVSFYAEGGDYKEARSYFERVVGPKSTFGMLEKLAFYYYDTGNKEAARYVFKDLIAEKPSAPKAYDYQYHIVKLYAAAGQSNAFREELYAWIERYGPEGVWAKANGNNKDLVAKSNQLIETTLRNFILQQHQTAQNSHSPSAQKIAREGYELYFQTFKESPKLDEMHFFYGELLFDLKDFERAAYHYDWVSENAVKSKYYEKSVVNSILAFEKRLPEPEEIKKIVGNATDPIEFDQTIKAFEKAALRYFQAIPKGESTAAIKYRLASLYYYYNQFDKAIVLFQQVIRDYPKTEYAEYSANLTLDIYNLKKDYVGLESAAQQILKNQEFASSKVGSKIKTIMQKSSFKRAEELEKSKDWSKSALAYEDFAKKNPSSELVITATYNAAVNYERAGDIGKALAQYSEVVRSKTPTQVALRRNSLKFMAALLEKTGQYEKAADAFESFANQNSKDKEAADFYYNAGIIRDGMNNHSAAIKNYQRYLELSHKSERSAAFFLMGKIYERRREFSNALNLYQKYFSAGPSRPESVIETALLIAQMNEALGRRKPADDWYGKTVSLQKRFASQTEGVGASFAAQAKFKLVYHTYEELRRVQIPANPQAQGKAVRTKLALLNRLKEDLKSVIRYDDGYQVVAALTTIGQAYQHMAASLYAAPVPKNLDADGLKEYKAGVDKIAKPFVEEAIKAYQGAVQKGFSLESYDDHIKTAVHELNAIRPGAQPDASEKVFLTKLSDPLSDDGAKENEGLRSTFAQKSESGLVNAASQLLAKDSNNLHALNLLGVFYFEGQKYGLAKIIFNRAILAHPNEPALHNNLGVTFLAEGNMRKAIAEFKKSLEIKNDYRVGATNLGSIYLEYRDYSRSVAPLEAGYKIIEAELKKNSVTPAAIQVASNYAVALAAQEQYDKARSIYKQIIEVSPRNVPILMNYAILLVDRMKNYSDAKEILSKLKFVTDDPAENRRIEELENRVRGAEKSLRDDK